MTDEEIVLNAIMLFEAIEQDDIDKTKILIDNLNNNFTPTQNVTNLNELFSFARLLENKNFNISNSLRYAIYNLNNITGMERIKWIVTTIDLLDERDKNKIETFIEQFINSNDPIIDYQMTSLVQMCVTIDNYDLLGKLRQKIAEGGITNG